MKKAFEYGYGKLNDASFYLPKTSWVLTPYGYESDPELKGVHKIAFICKTKQDQFFFKFVIIDAVNVKLFESEKLSPGRLVVALSSVTYHRHFGRR